MNLSRLSITWKLKLPAIPAIFIFYLIFFRTMIELFYLSFSKAKKNAQFTKNHNIIICIHLIAMRLKRAEK